MGDRLGIAGAAGIAFCPVAMHMRYFLGTVPVGSFLSLLFLALSYKAWVAFLAYNSVCTVYTRTKATRKTLLPRGRDTCTCTCALYVVSNGGS